MGKRETNWGGVLERAVASTPGKTFKTIIRDFDSIQRAKGVIKIFYLEERCAPISVCKGALGCGKNTYDETRLQLPG